MTKWVSRSGLAVLFVLAAACSGVPAAPTETATPVPTTAPTSPPAAAAPDTPTPPAMSAGPLRDVPRNRTVVMAWVVTSPIGVTNPWNTQGYNWQEGNNLLWEGLAYYAIFADKEIPWLAQSMTYNADFTTLTIKLNPLARWSDDVPVTSADVLFTFQGQLNNDQLSNHDDFQGFVRGMQAPDDHTVVLSFKKPAPRFKYEVLTMHFDNGVTIVPAHVLSKQADVNSFAGGLDMPHSGPYNLVYWGVDRKVYDLRPDWWAVQAGLIATPAARRVVIAQVGPNGVDPVAQHLAANDYDTSLDLRPGLITSLLKQNPQLTTYSGSTSPYGNLDWWPNSLWMNDQLAPYSDARVRRAMSLAINRDQINQVLYQGAPIATIYPFPLYPELKQFADSPDVKALEAKYQPGKFDLAESAQLMTEAGFVKNADGLWVKGGQTVNATIGATEYFESDLAPLLADMLKAGGFDAVVNYGNDGFDNVATGKAGLVLLGHGASTLDPYATFDLYHSRHFLPAGTTVFNYYFSRYKNPAYDQIVDAMAVLPADDPQFHALAAQAMEIYWRDVIDIPIIQWIHRIPYNTTYWTNWPTQTNPALGINGAFWAQTGMLLVTSLKPVQ